MNNYIVKGELSDATFGKVNKVEHKQSHKLFVMKKVDLSKLESKSRELAKQEAVLLQKLCHPYIVRQIETFEENGQLVLVQELYEKDLSQFISPRVGTGKLLDEDTIMYIFIQIVSAIRYIHHMNPPVCHRNIKLSNVFIVGGSDERPQIKLSGFDQAKEFASSQSNGMSFIGVPASIGTIAYHAPELFKQVAYDRKVDIWALGCLLYELCMLKPAFETGFQLEKRICSRNTQEDIQGLTFKKYSEGLRSLLEDMLNIHALKRVNIDNIFHNLYIQNYIAKLFTQDQIPDIEIDSHEWPEGKEIYYDVQESQAKLQQREKLEKRKLYSKACIYCLKKHWLNKRFIFSYNILIQKAKKMFKEIRADRIDENATQYIDNMLQNQDKLHLLDFIDSIAFLEKIKK